MLLPEIRTINYGKGDKNMKKIYALLILMILVLWMTSCKSTYSTPVGKLYESTICGSSNHIVWIPSENEVWGDLGYEKENMPDKTVTVLGKKYEGKYISSGIEKFTSFVVDRYRDSDGVDFYVRSDTDEIVFISFTNNNFFATEPYLEDVYEPEKNAVEIGTEVAKSFVEDFNEYVQKDVKIRMMQREEGCEIYKFTYYTLLFTRKICGYDSIDFVEVTVTSKGHVAAISVGETNAFDKTIVECDEETLNKSISEKINAEYEKQYPGINIKDIQYEDQFVTKTPEGEIVMYSDVRITLELKDSEGEEQTALEIITVLDYKY